ncbi:MAG: sugar phosphate isomerase/epimerase [Firmicutes bacterium]|nr:sugar phosphate isomerase/epimerase [Bacillota bacterium]
MKFAICNELFQGWEFARTVDCVAQVGYQGIELAPFTFADSVADITSAQRHGIRNTAEAAGLEIVGLHWLLTKPEGLHLMHPDKEVRAKTIAYLRQLVEFCAEVGGSVMTFGSPNQRRILPGMTRETAWSYAVEALRSCGEAASSYGVLICMEALPPAQTNFLNTNAEVRDLVRAVDHPNVRMMIDVKSMYVEEIPIPDNIRSCQGLFYHVHANDANQRWPGSGDVDFRPIFKALQDVGYHGYVSVEVFDFAAPPEIIAVEALNYMSQCLEDIGVSSDQ